MSGSGATVDPDGGFIADQPGTYIVTAASGNVSANASIVVTPGDLERELKIVGRVPMKEVQGAEQWIIGNYAYYSTISDRFMVYDISDPGNPKLTDTIKVDARLVNDIMSTADGKIWYSHARAPRTARTASSFWTPPIRRIQRCCRSTPRRSPAVSTARSSTASTSI